MYKIITTKYQGKTYKIDRNEPYFLSGSDRIYYRIFKESDNRLVKNLNTLEKIHAKIRSNK